MVGIAESAASEISDVSSELVPQLARGVIDDEIALLRVSECNHRLSSKCNEIETVWQEEFLEEMLFVTF